MKTFITYVLLLSFLIAGSAMAQKRDISGKVTSDKGNVLPGVTVQVKGTAIGTFTKTDGSYKISVPKTAKVLTFKLLGMKSKEVNIGEQDVINVALEEDKILMEEVVVTAIGLEREKKSIGYAMEDVGGRVISESKTTNVLNSLTGKVAGVQVTSSTGTPGASSFIRIRGTSSITGENQPLFVVDGTPIDNSMSYSGNPDDGNNNLLSSVAYSNRAIDLNSEDIESISVLKGPAATALYGLRASSGAIIITTKKGAAAVGEKINISFTTTMAFDEANKLPELQNKFAQGLNGQAVKAGTNEPRSWGGLIDTLMWDGKANKFDKNGNIVSKNDPSGVKPVSPYDNMGNFFQTGKTYIQSLNMAGGTDFGSFYLSLSSTDITGIVPRSEFKKQTVRFNGDARITSNLKASGTINYTNSGGTRIQQGSNTSGVMLGLLRTPPTFDNSNGFGVDGYDNPTAYMFADGTQRTYRGGGGYDNPLWTINRNPFMDNVDRYIGNFQLNWYLYDWWDVLFRIGADVYSDKRKQEFAINSRAFPSGQVFNHEIFNSDITSDLIMGFNQKLTDDLFGKLLIGGNTYATHYTSLYVQGDGLIVPNFYHVSNTSGQIIRQSDETLRRMAIYGDLTLDYNGWLYFNATVRNEWSTSLPKDKNSFLYGSGNLSFIFTEALKDMFKDTPISYGQLRLNYALVGKDAPIYATLTQYGQATYADGWVAGISFPFNGQVGYSLGDVLGNNKLTPESTTSLEVGLNLNFFDNLFGIDFTYYTSKSKEQIFNVPIASSSGFWRQIKNAGSLSNDGIEIVLNANPIRSDDFKWNLALNFSTNKNMIDELAPGVDNIFLGGFEGSSIRAVAGKPYGSIFGYGWLRRNGQVVINDDPDSPEFGYPILDPFEKDFGSANPDWLLGFRNEFNWEGITLSFLIDIKQGGVIWNGTKGALYYFGTSKETEIRGTTKVFDGVKGHYDADGNLVSNSDFAKNDLVAALDQNWLAFGNGNGFYGNNTEDFIEDAGWIRLREVSLSYQLPKTIVEVTPFSDIIVTFTGRNLWLSTDYTGVDPETSLMGAANAQGLDYYNMPGTRTYNFSLNVKF